jgi:DNA-directed RNA polymerase specialized sigma24 family protein
MGGLDRRAEALRRLPSAYALALRLRDAGVTAEVIAAAVGVDPEALGPLLALAEAKLATVLGEEAGPSH